MKTPLKTLLLIGLSLGLVTGLFITLDYGLTKAERLECNTWQTQSERYDGFYLSDWQEDQCTALGIQVDTIDYSCDDCW